MFIDSLLWGVGLSLGLCVGLSAWMFLCTAIIKILGLSEDRDNMRDWDERSLEALLERNRLTTDTNAILNRIVEVAESD